MAYDLTFDSGLPRENEAPSAPPNTAPALAAFRNVFTTPQSQEWAHEVSTRLNDYVQKRQLALKNIQLGNQFVSNIDAFKQGLLQFVKADPHGLPTAMDLVQPTIRSLIEAHPGVDSETAQDHHDALVNHLHSELATAAVTALAQRNAAQARDMLNNERVSSVLQPKEKEALNTFINTLDRARAIDQSASMRQKAKQAQDIADGTLHHYLSSLIDPRTEQITAPPTWNQEMLQDPSLTPGHRVAAAAIYNHLQTYGDVKESDPFLTTQLISQMANGNPPPFSEVIRHAGTRLTLPDALHLSAFTRPTDAAGQARLQAIHGILQQAQTLLMGHDGENGPAGASAYGRFVNWAMPQIRRGANLNPQADNYLFSQGAIHNFMPNGDDVVRTSAPTKRVPLSEIFGGGKHG